MIIYKYELTRNSITIPRDFRPISVQMQHKVPVLWAKVDDPNDKVNLPVIEVYTGEPFKNKPSYLYIGTVQQEDGIVSHFFIDLIPIP